MCLSEVYRGKKKKDFLATLPDVITVWKVARKGGRNNYKPLYHGKNRYVAGANKASSKKIEYYNSDGGYWGWYQGGFHFWQSKSFAVSENSHPTIKAIPCKINKADITSVGEQWNGICIVARKATFPKYCGEKK